MEKLEQEVDQLLGEVPRADSYTRDPIPLFRQAYYAQHHNSYGLVPECNLDAFNSFRVISALQNDGRCSSLSPDGTSSYYYQGSEDGSYSSSDEFETRDNVGLDKNEIRSRWESVSRIWERNMGENRLQQQQQQPDEALARRQYYANGNRMARQQGTAARFQASDPQELQQSFVQLNLQEHQLGEIHNGLQQQFCYFPPRLCGAPVPSSLASALGRTPHQAWIAPAHQQGLLGKPRLQYGSRSRQLCRYFIRGHCKRAQHCSFLHPESIARRNERLVQKSETSNQLVEAFEGHIVTLAKDANGCRFLQEKLETGRCEEVQVIVHQILQHVVELMTDQYGNYLVQKLLEKCSEDERLQVVRAVCSRDLVAISLHQFGTRAVQKLIDTLASPSHVSIILPSLSKGFLTLVKDTMGNHVLQRCLQSFSNEENQFIFDAAGQHCVEIATHKHGCCVLQRCIDFATGKQKERLIGEIVANGVELSQDDYGNYVVQFVVTKGATSQIVARLRGQLVQLSMHKCSSNVVQKCLEFASDEDRARMIEELVSSPLLPQLVVDPYANYVIKTALDNSKGWVRSNLIKAIQPYSIVLRNSRYGKRILLSLNR